MKYLNFPLHLSLNSPIFGRRRIRLCDAAGKGILFGRSSGWRRRFPSTLQRNAEEDDPRYRLQCSKAEKDILRYDIYDRSRQYLGTVFYHTRYRYAETVDSRRQLRHKLQLESSRRQRFYHFLLSLSLPFIGAILSRHNARSQRIAILSADNRPLYRIRRRFGGWQHFPYTLEKIPPQHDDAGDLLAVALLIFIYSLHG